jgi:hypothetical protein
MASDDDKFVSDGKLTPEDFRALAAGRGQGVVRARKIGYVAAVQAETQGPVETRWNGKETVNTAQVGDWIATNLSADRQPLRDSDGNLNTYVIRADRFADLYEKLGATSALGDVYKAKATVTALALSGGFDILAPWGERQTGDSGYLILNGDEVYGIAAAAFEATYEVLSD